MKGFQFIRTTIIGGVVFLLPLVVIIIIVSKAFGLMKTVASRFEGLMPVDHFLGILVVDILAAVGLLLVCFIAGLFAGSKWISMYRNRMHERFKEVIPLYRFLSDMINATSEAEKEGTFTTPVLVELDEGWQVGFQVEAGSAGLCTVYMPGAANPMSGTVMVFNEKRIRVIDASTTDIFKALGRLGPGTLEIMTSDNETA